VCVCLLLLFFLLKYWAALLQMSVCWLLFWCKLYYIAYRCAENEHIWWSYYRIKVNITNCYITLIF
jgi:hypothetical protein